MAQSGLTKAELRRLYTPVSDGGAAARQVIESWMAASRAPESVFCYVGGRGECSTAPVLCFCLKQGIPLAVPLCGPGGVMTARRLTDFSGLRQGRYGILEPSGDAEEMGEPDVVIVPGIAFDRDGYRLGRGGGYYDRYLAGRGCRTIGLCRSGRLLDYLPRDEWDVPVGLVVTGGQNAGEQT